MLTIITNNKHITKKYDKPYLINSDQPMMNTKYRISKYLTSVFCGLPIDIETRNKYFLRIRQLLLDKLVVIENRLKKQKKNRQTTTYIKFSHGRRTWYLGFYIPCLFCSNVCAYVMSRNRKVCQNCRSKVIVTPTPPPQDTFKNYCQSKQIVSKRIGVTYTKKVSMHSGTGNYLVTYSNLGINKQFKTMKEQEKYKKSEYFLKLRKKKEVTFECEDIKVAEQSTGVVKNIMINDITTSFQELEIREQDNVLPWQEILRKQTPITRPEFYGGQLKIFLVKIIQEYSRDDIDIHELKIKINELGMWDIGRLYDFTFLMKNQISCQLMELLRCYKITEKKLLYKVLKQIIGRVLLEFKVLIWEPRNELQIKEEKRCGISIKD
ncbi:hypothetical protein GLOIN_2v1762782 [Rhizophagus irregularis DAOM 181602=DAOM 197198]|uniref:Uncharacterized protein n=1 Tax=Rhizophagus irregularis (strain DAOM 181602 / DAOM 197198 / MUCL 43194) TaxID=747089 RepID=A0A2P4QWC8_RHIID|nr:hypothetical protein GLOIN_2v1762782 [Rhizophagus irregularis DAOM 181602=DAOM 197198]POG81892.1 hypothetical protein GLOIN_2v1762782 [Rhizophagus irregularis DAOM 181602=DAOM 197198]|eukprot:XP_025188758.1 hypothetical protein GLOIN_2v1762782 [Rhizophagus irregularis DAOM 181602=DAOM 197198]